MFLTRNEYDRGVNTFSPEGRLFQVEYAIEAIKLGTTAIGIQTSEGVVLVAEKKVVSPLQIPSTIHKVFTIDKHIGCVMSGLAADAETIVDHARTETQFFRFTYEDPMTVEACTQSICDLALRFGHTGDEDDEKGMSRPFGVALLIAGIDPDGSPMLYHMDPSGTFIRYMAKAIGAASEGAQTSLEEKYNQSMSLEDAKLEALRILKQVMEDKVNKQNVEVAVASVEDRSFRRYSDDEVELLLAMLD
uniref:Proteasome subunit alpha type n=1 Tax=Stygiella incarcerata TaxID=1712417 RepID=A0A192ZHI2_9EUKA|nr:proteasome subunit alpha type-5-A [Stygiella incarcerata]|eukprot:TRINITY_DN81727_c0_g1_i1.p1 TRINITY_DN81727_c0_g1~~TRINITY_DN81727_c0_g1_i1.p1  ORF type:complete len:247 (-),score=67.96 TRINITY_DN81727_c0_g1_i1:198-938(-)